ncbi:hypothetical protein QNH46_14875 [Paenibacillus woosongensis]|uniref:Tetratricopeptide repeat protein n=1 Tax=Paenibacillus woosongensis TaxID=307580 RepID=A0AA95KUI4_9BACL|nr:hypothetical protein [Paenibacillus woosongensis]WHX47440.1 hypothetical protein QNH46_14875 [Paenibacillus woosongensis]
MNRNELCESAAETTISADLLAAERLMQIGLNLRLTQGSSDDEIALSLRDVIEQDKLPGGRKLLVLVLHQLGAYDSASAWITRDMFADQQIQLVHAEILLRSGEAEQALSFIEDCLTPATREDADFWDQMSRLSDLSRLMAQRDYDRNKADLYRLAGLINLAVKLGHTEIASQLAGSEVDLQCLLISALYQEGYIEAAKRHLCRLPDPLLLGSLQLYREIAFISAEMLHDEGCYEKACRIFETLIRQAPEMARARFGAASCYLQQTMDNLVKRIELYHPSEEEQRKIDKYLDTLQQTLLTLEKSNWHTSWTPVQQKNIGGRDKRPLN